MLFDLFVFCELFVFLLAGENSLETKCKRYIYTFMRLLELGDLLPERSY